MLSTAGKTSADAVIVATGPRPRHAGVPSPEPVMRPLDRYGAALLIRRTDVSNGPDVIRGDGVTIRRLAPEHMLVAGHRRLRTGQDPARAALGLRDATLRLLGAGEATIDHTWSAPIGITTDATPHVWRSDGMWFGGGYNGDALVPALTLGSQLGEVLSGIRTQTIFSGITPTPVRINKPGGRIAILLDQLRRE